MGSLFIPYNNLDFLVFTGKDDYMKCLELTPAGYREELETVGQLSMARIKLAFKHMATRKVISYQNQDVTGFHQGVNQAINLFKWTQDRKYVLCSQMRGGNPVGFSVPIIAKPHLPILTFE